MKFTEMQYERPNLDEALSALEWLRTQLNEAQSAAAQLDLLASFETLSRHLTTMSTLAEIRHTVDTRDAFYEGETEFWDANSPAIADRELDIYRALLASPFRPVLEKKLGRIAFDKMEVDVKSQTPEVLDLMARENALTTEYEKLYASAQIEFDGKTLTVSEMSPYKTNPDRAVRRAAYAAEGAWFDSHRETLDRLYDELVHNRTAQARAMGYENFIPLGAIRMRRIGYTLADMAAYRGQVKRDVVPLVARLKAQQFARAGVAGPRYYDDELRFADGNPEPQGTPDEILAAGKQMYHSLSPETAAFIDDLFAAGCFDVLSKPGKAPGGYCTYLPDYKLPFIFSNFNATADDVDVLTHEAGHAFAAWVAAKKEYPMILEEPGMESCEIHSMSMEFLTQDYHALFFGPRTERYELAHAEDSLFFLPYGTMVDEFQHLVYAQPDLSPAQRNELWAGLEKTYRPWIDFDALPFYGRGAGWQRQLHIYENPFYYLDYCLAQSVALQFFALHLHDAKDAWERYVTLVEAAGTMSYPDLVRTAGLLVPFEEGAMPKIAGAAGAWIEQQNQKMRGA